MSKSKVTKKKATKTKSVSKGKVTKKKRQKKKATRVATEIVPMTDSNDPTYDRIIKSRIRLLMKHPFFGQLCIRMPFVDATNSEYDWLHTAATDMKYIYYNKNFIDTLSDEELDFVLGHEVLHCAFSHPANFRRRDRHPLIWNFAIDFVTNAVLKEQNIGKMPDGVLYDQQFENMTSEEIYDILIKDIQKSKKKCEGGTLDQHCDGLGDDGDEDGDSNGKGKAGSKGSGSGKKKKKKKKGDGIPKPDISDEEMKNRHDKMKEATMQAAASCEAGEVPAGIRRLIKELTESKIDWRDMLNVVIKSQHKDNFTYMRPSRRCMDSDFILPSMDNADKIEVTCAIDTSGSMSDNMLQDFLGEVKGIMAQFHDFKLSLMTFDTEIYNFKEFEPSNIHEIDTYSADGGGGTDFEVVWSFLKERDHLPKQLVMFTDGYPCGEWGDEHYCDTLFIIHSHHDENFMAPFGLTVHYTEQGKTS